MLRTMPYRNPEMPYGAGEPEAWEEPRRPTRARPAPWHQPYAEERSGFREYARRSGQPSSGRDLARPRADYASRHTDRTANADRATADDFRDLARSIERMRHSRTAVAPYEGSSREPAGRAEARHAPVYGSDFRRELRQTESRVREDRTVEAVAREIARAADKSDVRRLEDLLNEVLERLDRLDSRESEPARTSRPATARPARTRQESREREPEDARSTRYRAAAPRREPEYAEAYEASPSRPAPRGTTPRRLWP